MQQESGFLTQLYDRRESGLVPPDMMCILQTMVPLETIYSTANRGSRVHFIRPKLHLKAQWTTYPIGCLPS